MFVSFNICINFLSTQNLPLLDQFPATPEHVTVRHSSRTSTPLNTIILFVPQQESWVVERMGKFNRILEPGLNLLLPFVDRVKYVQSLKEIAIDVPKQSAITVDNVRNYLKKEIIPIFKNQ